MSHEDDLLAEVGELTSTLCDGRITTDEAARLERLVLESNEARRYFVDYLDLHGELHWDGASAARSATEASSAATRKTSDVRSQASQASRRDRGAIHSRWWFSAIVGALLAVVVALVVVVVIVVQPGWRPPNPGAEPWRIPTAPQAPGAGSASVAALRDLASRHVNLIHHYTFEGTTRREKRQDSAGQLHLTEAVMNAGRGFGQLDYLAAGFDPSSQAVRPFRDLAPTLGNDSGTGLQTEHVFHPPDAMTVELLLLFEELPLGQESPIAAAVATRADERDCGFLVVTVDQGQLAHLMDGEADWTLGDFEFVPGQWYYLASTFRVDPESRTTTVNTFAANLGDGERRLRHVVQDQVVSGTPAASRLGIGKAFENTMAHAYPWSGAIDEVAIYDAALDRETLQEHLEAVLGR